MTDQHVKGAVNTVKGTVNEGVGKLTGDKKQETKGTVQKVEGKVQDKLGDVQDAVPRTSTPDPWGVSAGLSIAHRIPRGEARGVNPGPRPRDGAHRELQGGAGTVEQFVRTGKVLPAVVAMAVPVNQGMEGTRDDR